MGVYGIDKAKEMANRHAENAAGKYIKLPDDGDKIVIAFIGEPFAREVVWIERPDGGRAPEEYDEGKHGPEKQAKPRMLVSWNCYDFEGEKVRVWEQGVTFFRTWLQANEKYGNTWAFELKRNGAKGSKKTTYSVFPERQLSADELATIAKLDTYDLADPSDSMGDSSGANGASATGGGVIDADTANKLIADLKALRDAGKGEVLAEFLNAFGVEAIRDVPKARGDEALAFVAKHTGSETAAQGATAERDPFA